MYKGIPRLRASGSSIMNYLTVAQLRRKAMNSLSAVQDTFYSTKVTVKNPFFLNIFLYFYIWMGWFDYSIWVLFFYFSFLAIFVVLMLQDIFERHKVVFTISTSIASVATAWAGMFFPLLYIDYVV